MTRLPRISGKDLVKALSKIGFAVIRIRGSHHFMEHEDGRATVVPVHSNET
ncbi:MAG TPA: type II toxin-antitoxin system HicA family toxin, partial [Ignavibacteria bacterium]|nr:type II toxin-antitoxin system HicA family toxin [Ignavibacteria bacterium]